MELKISIVTCSDTRDLAQDEAGAALEELIEAQGWTVASHVVVRDDVSEIGDAIVESADECHANVVLTCGGTGLSRGDAFRLRPRCAGYCRGNSCLLHDQDAPRHALARYLHATRSYTCRKLSRFYEGRPRKLGGHSRPAGACGSDDGGRRTYQLSGLPAAGRPERLLRLCFLRIDAEVHGNLKLYSLTRIISHYHYSRRSII